MDQAARLRKLVEERKVDQIRVDQKKTARIISVTSGKGGVGKTNQCFSEVFILLFFRRNRRRI